MLINKAQNSPKKSYEDDFCELFLLSWASLGYLGLAWASMLTGTR
jgi:hypothetical protein